jgi:hypothetical protein
MICGKARSSFGMGALFFGGCFETRYWRWYTSGSPAHRSPAVLRLQVKKASEKRQYYCLFLF